MLEKQGEVAQEHDQTDEQESKKCLSRINIIETERYFESFKSL